MAGKVIQFPKAPKPSIGPLADQRYRARVRRQRNKFDFNIREQARDHAYLAVFFAFTSPFWAALVWIVFADWLAVPTFFAVLVWRLGLPERYALVGLVWIPYYAWWTKSERPLPDMLAKPVAARTVRIEQWRLNRKLNVELKIMSVKRTHYVKRLTVVIPPTLTADQVNALGPNLTNAYAFAKTRLLLAPFKRMLGIQSAVKVTITSPKPPIAVIHIHLHDPLAHDPDLPVYVPTRHGDIPLGVDFEGEERFIRLFEHSVVTAGRRGSGKSTTTNWMIWCTIQLPYRDIRIFDGKDGMDLRWAFKYATEVSTDVPTGLAMLENALGDLHARKAELGARNISLCPIGEKYPLVVILIDEFATLLKPKGSKDALRAEYLIGEINRLGRAAGFVVWAATQDLRKVIVSGELVAQFTHKLGFAVNTGDDSDVILPGAKDSGYDLSKIPLDRPGCGVLMGGTPRFVQVRTYRAWDKALDKLKDHLDKLEIEPAVKRGEPPKPETSIVAELSERSRQNRKLTPDEIAERAVGKIRAAGEMGVALKTVADDLGVTVKQARGAVNKAREANLVWCDGRRWRAKAS